MATIGPSSRADHSRRKLATAGLALPSHCCRILERAPSWPALRACRSQEPLAGLASAIHIHQRGQKGASARNHLTAAASSPAAVIASSAAAVAIASFERPLLATTSCTVAVVAGPFAAAAGMRNRPAAPVVAASAPSFVARP